MKFYAVFFDNGSGDFTQVSKWFEKFHECKTFKENIFLKENFVILSKYVKEQSEL